MEIHDKASVEKFAIRMCEYTFLKLGVIKCNVCETTQSDGLFTEAIGKTVLYHRILMRDCLSSFFTCNFNRIVADVVSIAYEFCSRIYTFSSEVPFAKQFFRLSACVLELFLYCKESSITEVKLCGAPRVWMLIFDLVLKNDFYRHGGWDNIAMHARLYSVKLSPCIEPLIEHIKDPYEEFPDIGDLPSEFAYTSCELNEAFEKSYSESILCYLSTIPLPSFFRKVDLEDDEDDPSKGGISPPAKRFKRVHQVFDYN